MISGIIGASIGLVFVTIVVPLWIVAHYITKWRTARALQPEDEGRFAELQTVLERLERRMETIERIVEVDSPTGRDRHGP